MEKPRQLTKQEYTDALDRWVKSEYRERAPEIQSSRETTTTDELKYQLSESEKLELARWLHSNNLLD